MRAPSRRHRLAGLQAQGTGSVHGLGRGLERGGVYFPGLIWGIRTMKKDRRNRREFLGLTGTGIAGLVGGSLAGGSLIGAPAVADAQGGAPPNRLDADLVVFNAKVYTVDSRAPRAEAFAVKANRFVAVGSNRGHQGTHRQGDPDLRRQADDHRARVHRLPQSCARQHVALRRPGRQSLRGRVRDHRQHRRQTPRESPRRRRRALGSKGISSTTPR